MVEARSVNVKNTTVRLGQSFKTVGYGCTSCWGDVGAGDAEADVIYVSFIVSVQQQQPLCDHVPDWQPRILLGMVEVRSVNVKNTTVRLGQSFKTVGYGCTSCWGDVGSGDAEADVIYVSFIVSVQHIEY